MRVTGTVVARCSSSVRDVLEEEPVTITTPPPAAGIRPFPACPACGTVFAEVRGTRLHVAEGGHAAFLAALQAPERVSRLLAINAAHPWLRQRQLLPQL